jgi:hypothetical protein
MGARALGGAGLRDMLADDRVWFVLGTVALHEGETGHYETNDEGDLQVTVVTHGGTPVTALLGGAFGSSSGTWSIPDPGDEVMVAFSEGQFEGDAVVVGVVGRGAPAGLAPGTVVTRADDQVKVDAPEILLGGGAGHQPTFQADAFMTALSALIDSIATAAAGVGGGVTTAIQSAWELFDQAAPTFTTTVTKVK